MAYRSCMRALACSVLFGTGAWPTGFATASTAPETCGCPGAHAQTADADRKQILEVINHLQEAWNRGDFRGYMQGFKNPDVIFVSGGRFQDGWQGTLDHYIREYGRSAEVRGTLRFYDISIEILSPDAAQLISHYELKRPQHPQYGINTRLLRKVAGQWLIALNHVSSSEVAPAANAPAAGPPTR
jgi:ketosteroid isomerase-like protein